MQSQYSGLLATLAYTRCRPLLCMLIEDTAYKEKLAEQNFGLLRSNAAFRRCMAVANSRWRWLEEKLR